MVKNKIRVMGIRSAGEEENFIGKVLAFSKK